MTGDLTLAIDGEDHVVPAGLSVAAALRLVAPERPLRLSHRSGEPRAMFCGMGVCFDCLVVIDGVRDVRACMTTVKAGMRIETR